MQLQHILSTVLTAAVLLGTPLAASAEPASSAAQLTTTSAPRVAVVDDAALYAQREQQSPAAAKFEGGGNGVYIGGSALVNCMVMGRHAGAQAAGACRC